MGVWVKKGALAVIDGLIRNLFEYEASIIYIGRRNIIRSRRIYYFQVTLEIPQECW